MAKHGKHIGKQKAREMLEHGKVRGHKLSEKQRGLFGLIAGGGSPTRMHRSFGEDTDAYNDTALGETPPHVSIPRGHPVRPSLPTAVGRPAGVRESEGVEAPRTDVQTKRAALPSTPVSKARRWPSKVRSYEDTNV